MRNVEHDDFDFDFSDDDFVEPVDLDEAESVILLSTVGPQLRVLQRGSRDYIGHLVENEAGQIWMLNPHEMIPSRDYGLELIARESFEVDEDEVCDIVANHDAFVREFSEFNLTLATINGLPLLLPCVEH